MSALLRASVIEVSRAAIRLDIGAVDEVEVGMRFAVLANRSKKFEEEGGTIRAIIEITEVYDDSSLARVPSLQQSIKRGISNSLFPGVGVGAIIGTLLAGPIGAVVGAAIGGSIPAIAFSGLTKQVSIQVGDEAIQAPVN